LPSEGEKTLVIAGGVGAAPLAPYAEAARSEGSEVHTVLGARSADDLLLRNALQKQGRSTFLQMMAQKGQRAL